MDTRQFIILYSFENREGMYQNDYEIVDSTYEKEEYIEWLLGSESFSKEVIMRSVVELGKDSVIQEYKNNKPKICI